jgi:RNA polymerase sigma-70 factor (ECF subfamily)
MSTPDGDDARRFSELYARNYGPIYAYAARRVGVGAADEIAAETFLIAWRRLDAIATEPLPWLYGVARNVVLRHRSAAGRQARIERALAHEPPELSSGQHDGDRDPQLSEVWEQLSAVDREVLALVAWEELSVAEGARVIGCPAPVFSVRLHRARRRLARLLESPSQVSGTEMSEVR